MLRWWLIVSSFIVGSTILYKFNMFEKMYDADISKLSVIILCLFTFFTLQIGRLTYYKSKELDVSTPQVHTCWFMADSMTTIGMMGTIIGFLIMLGTAFSNLNVTEVASIQQAIKFMSLGMSTALVTTLVGMVCGWLLRLQLVNYENG